MSTTDRSRRFAAGSTYAADDRERRLFRQHLASFVPPRVFDVHAQLYHTDAGLPLPDDGGVATFTHWQAMTQDWMGDRAPTAGLFFGFPARGRDTGPDNRLVAEQVRHRPGSRGLMLVRPHDDPAAIEQAVREQRWAGFKVYHVYADREQSFRASIEEFLPRWMWELADRHGLVLMLHMVRPRGLAGPDNQRVIRRCCKDHPGAKLVLAHAARGFCADHTIAGVEALRGLDNVFFDTSAVCESPALIAILQRCGASRLMYGSDFPISQQRGRHVSLGDGYYWLHDNNTDYEGWLHDRPVLVGIESLLALRQAAPLSRLRDDDIERIFSTNARQMLDPPDR